METVISEGENLRGVIFFCILSMQDLKIKCGLNKCLIEKGTRVLIPLSLNDTKYIEYDEISMLQYHGEKKIP